MSKPRFTGDSIAPPQVGTDQTPSESNNHNFVVNHWARRTRQKVGFIHNPEWPNKPEPPPTSPPIYKMVPPSPPIIGKQPPGIMPYPFNQSFYPNMAIKDDRVKDPKIKFPMANYIGPSVNIPPGSYMPGPIFPMANVGVETKPVFENRFGAPFVHGPYYKEPPIPPVTYKQPPIHNPNYDRLGFVNLSQVKGMSTGTKRNYETMSEISDDQESSGSDEKNERNDATSKKTYEIKYFTPFLPKPPERYKTEYDLHELKVFLPLGVKAYLKNMSLNPKLSSGFETGPVRNGKLVLLLDLDNTLLHTASQSRLDMLNIDTSDFVDSLGDPELYTFTLPNFPNVNYYMKLRPCIREFLQILSLYYEMSIYTNATKEYADVVISILDPDRSLFMDRIVARSSVDEKDLLKSASRLYPDLDTRFILAFDDRRDVWSDIPHKQVVRAEHYDFFESYITELNNNYSSSPTPSNKQTPEPNSFNLTTNVSSINPGKTVNDYTFNIEQESESDPDVTREKVSIVDYDRHLKYMVKIFLEIHKRFFADPFNNDVGSILETIQSQVLKGIGVLLTGYRKNTKVVNSVLHADCELRQKENLLELGASLVLRLNDSKLTHIMAGKNCTDNITKSRDPQYNHIHKVHTLWLYSCRATFSKVDESLFKVDDICKIYSNEPPQLPNKDHWKFINPTAGSFKDSNKNDNGKSKQELPTRIFMGTGAYSNGTEVLSSVEKIVIRWDPSKTKLLQNSISDNSRQNIKQQKSEYTPFTNAINPNKFAF